MNTSEKSSIEFYKELFQLQDRVLEIVDSLEVNLYLTGGTALSRFHLNHRFSDDLDFVTHKDPYFGDYIQRITEALVDDDFEVKPFGISSTFAALHLYTKGGDKMRLKLDFVNEKSAPHFGDLISAGKYSKVDNIRNILSNKISILARDEPKDFSDIWFICKNLDFRWDEIIEEANRKRILEEIFVTECLRNFQIKKLSAIKWIGSVEIQNFEKDRDVIIEDIISKNRNRLSGNS